MEVPRGFIDPPPDVEQVVAQSLSPFVETVGDAVDAAVAVLDALRHRTEYVRVADVLPTKAKDLPWTWEDEERNIRTRQCLCCGRPGHYQEMLEAHMAEHGVEGMGILVNEGGYLGDGHHRVVAAIRLGIDRLPIETTEDCQARWVRDHGHVDWHHRKFGDR